MKIAFISTYPPKQCGIGTFTHNLLKAVRQSGGYKRIDNIAIVIAVNEKERIYKYSSEVKYTIRQSNQKDYVNAAEFINYSDADVCILEHEFGIFGGDDGVYILPLLHKLEVPFIVTFHTVLKNPSYTQRSIIEEIGKRAARIVVMSKRAINFLTEIYGISTDKIVLIEHGVPEFERLSREKAKEKFGLEKRKVLFTFGLLSRNKGIETVINALPKVVNHNPDLLYIVLGATHPNVLKSSGEEYRNYLSRLVNKLDLERNVYFNNEFISETELFDYLSACDIYVTPYLNEAQITSGTLSYAIGAGCAVVSTPYWHAQELLDGDRGCLFSFKNADELADILNELLSDHKKLAVLRENAFQYGKRLRWPKIGKQYLLLAEYVFENWKKTPEVPAEAIDLSLLPAYDITHVKRLTDDTGIVQHAKYGIPNLKEGYCVDDNARALLFSVMAWRQNQDQEALELMPVYLSFINYMQLDKGNFRNYLSFSRQFLDHDGSEDSFGRTVWALGYLIRFAPNDAFKQIAREFFLKSVQHFDQLRTIRGAANTIIGICYYIKDVQNDEEMVNRMNKLTHIIVDAYNKYSFPGWHWFEDVMTYDNGILPLALFSAYEITGNETAIKIAGESLKFLESVTFRHGYFSPVGNKGWFRSGDTTPPEFDQQSIDVMAIVLLYYQVYQVMKDHDYAEKLFIIYQWFLGENSLRLPLFDHETMGCCDGLGDHGLNRNQGAESTLAYWISHLTVLSAQEKEHIYLKKEVELAK